MSRYRKIDVRMYGDEAFRALSPPAPCGQSVFVYLLTGPHTTNIPGLFSAGEAGLAEALGWPLKGFREAFAEACRKPLVKADWHARLCWVPNAIKFNKPESPNVVLSWRVTWDELPECDLKYEAYQQLKAFLEGMGKAFAEAFEEACRKPLRKPSLKAMANQEQDQDQEQEQEQEQDISREVSNSRAVAVEGVSAETWKAYASAYRDRYGADPVRNRQVNSQLKKLVELLGEDEAPPVAAFYLSCHDQRYVMGRHPANLLLLNATGLRTQWFTGIKATRGEAQSAEKKQGMDELFKRIRAERSPDPIDVTPPPPTAIEQADNEPLCEPGGRMAL